MKLEAITAFCARFVGAALALLPPQPLRLEAPFSSPIPTLPCCPDQTPKYFHISFGKILGGLFMAIAEAHICAQFAWDIWKPRNWSVWEFGTHGTYLPLPQKVSLSLQDCRISWVLLL